jgi:hypothetical protein
VSATPTFYQWLGDYASQNCHLEVSWDCTCPMPPVHRVYAAMQADEWFRSTKAPIRTSFAQIRRRFADKPNLLADLGVAWDEFARLYPGRARQSLKRVLADPVKPTLAALPTAFPWRVRIPAYRVGEITAELPGAFAITPEHGRPDVRWLWLSNEAYQLFMERFAGADTGTAQVAV